MTDNTINILNVVKDIIKTNYAIDVCQLQPLFGYSSDNFLVASIDSQFIYKQYPYSKALINNLNIINEVLSYLPQKTDYVFPLAIISSSGTDLITYDHADKRVIGRLLTYVKGDMLVNQPLNATLLRQVGSLLAQLDHQLMSFHSSRLLDLKDPWHLSHYHLSLVCLRMIPNTKDRKIISDLFEIFKSRYDASIKQLRHSIIHNDANESNLLFNNKKTLSLIDFDDLSYAPLVYELAVCLAYMLIISEDPLRDMLLIVKQYHVELPLYANEIAELYYLIAIRLCVSICQSEHDRTLYPDNDYIYSPEVMEKKIAALHYWVSVSPESFQSLLLESLSIDMY